MRGKRNIYLIGPMGTGKSAVGEQIGACCGVPFFDSDAEIERHAGVDIPYIFEREGEAGFRSREREALAHLCQQEPIVLATGGGAVLAPENRKLLQERGRRLPGRRPRPAAAARGKGRGAAVAQGRGSAAAAG